MELSIEGRVVCGLGRGRQFLAKKRYRQQFIDKLGIEAVGGTLNLSVEDVEKLDILHRSKGILIEGFVEDDIDYGDVKAFPAEIRNIPVAVLLPQRSCHEKVIELISNKLLRDELDLENGDTLNITVYLD